MCNIIACNCYYNIVFKKIKPPTSKKSGALYALISSESSSALRAEIKIFRCLISTLSALLVSDRIASALHYSGQMTLLNLNLFASCDSPSDLRIKLVNRSAAAGLHIVALVPLKRRYEEKRQHRVCHEHVESPISSTDSAGHKLVKRKVLPAISYSHDKKHSVTLLLS